MLHNVLDCRGRRSTVRSGLRCMDRRIPVGTGYVGYGDQMITFCGDRFVDVCRRDNSQRTPRVRGTGERASRRSRSMPTWGPCRGSCQHQETFGWRTTQVVLDTEFCCELCFGVSSSLEDLDIPKRDGPVRKGCRSRPAASAATIGSSFEGLLRCITCTDLRLCEEDELIWYLRSSVSSASTAPSDCKPVDHCPGANLVDVI
jgi:hypothetical protein